MRAILTILWDSVLLLRARKLFWVVMWISLLVGLIYASISFGEDQVSILFGLWSVDVPVLLFDPEIGKVIYLLFFTNLIIPHWLGFLVIIMALVTSCSVFPELMKEGSVETVISKPVPRWQIFFVKYLGMLGFMAIPLTLFCLIVFVALGLRVEVWKPEIFLAVPLLTFVFSILYSFAVFIGVWTRSTLFALFSALLLWGILYFVHVVETGFYNIVVLNPSSGVSMENFEPGEIPEIEDEPLPVDQTMEGYYKGFRRTTWLLPKPRKATLYMKNFLVFEDELGRFAGLNLLAIFSGQTDGGFIQDAQAEADKRMSVTEVVVPSVLFQFLMLGIGAVIFCRRDF